MSVAVRVLERVLLIGGLALFAYLLYDLGAATVLANLRVVGWGIVPIMLQEILAFLANAAGWRLAFSRPGPAVPFAALLGARIAGDAVNYLTPTATFGGEFVRGRMLRGHASTTSIVASLAVAKLTQTIGLLAFVAIGGGVALNRGLLSPSLQSGLFLGLGVFTAAVAVLLLLLRRGLFTGLFRFAQDRLGLGDRPHLAQALRRLDGELAGVHANGDARLVLSSASFCLGWAVGTVENYLILWFLGLPATLERALTIEVITVAFNNLLFFVPLRAGTQEGATVLAFTMLGFSPAAGLATGILYRVRELTWALIGLIILSRHHIRLRAIRDASASARSVAREPSP
ncbi:MAG: flippase-like domain-containing protein [Candidatus Rokubacteria bacterium]|nr:flippase-like domain-containing protein [Candidatus Rokubacteria bacterium]